MLDLAISAYVEVFRNIPTLTHLLIIYFGLAYFGITLPSLAAAILALGLIGGAVMTDYNFRGISQSDRGPAVNAYFEGRYNSSKDVQWYAGVSATSVKLATDPAAEVDLYGGARFTFGSWVLDIGGMYYLYPGERAIDGTIITAPPAFNTTFAATVASAEVGPLPTTVLIAGDDADAKALLAEVISAGGLRAGAQQRRQSLAMTTPGADLGQLGIGVDLDAPGLVLGQMPVEPVELVPRHQLDEPADLGAGIELARDV